MTDVPLQIWPLLCEALTDPDLRNRAEAIFKHATDGLLAAKEERQELHASDAGRCRLELWAALHGKLDLPENPETILTRFDLGALFGAWNAALLAAALEKYAPHLETVLEPVVVYRSVTGHIDALVRDRETKVALWVVEFKSTYFSRPPDAPDKHAPYQVLQAATYAKATEAPLFTLFIVAPAVQKVYDKATKTRYAPPKYRQDDYRTADWAADVDEEIDRLETATEAQPPEQDVQDSWRCASCRLGACPLNERHGFHAAEIAS